VYVENNSRVFSDIPDSKETNLDAEEADEVYTELVQKYDEQDTESKENVIDEHTEDNDIGREVSCEDCEQCGGTLYKTSSTVHAKGFGDSFEAKCSECGHTQYIPSW